MTTQPLFYKARHKALTQPGEGPIARRLQLAQEAVLRNINSPTAILGMLAIAALGIRSSPATLNIVPDAPAAQIVHNVSKVPTPTTHLVHGVNDIYEPKHSAVPEAGLQQSRHSGPPARVQPQKPNV